MQVITDSNSLADILFDHPFFSPLGFDIFYGKGHDQIAEIIVENGWKTLMVSTCADRLHDDLWDDPKYMVQNHFITKSLSYDKAVDVLCNKWFSQDELDEIIKRKNFPIVSSNKPDPEEKRSFKVRLEDEIFQYQIQKEMFFTLRQIVDHAEKYLLDEDGFPIENEDGEWIEASPDVVEKQVNIVLERYLLPRTSTHFERAYVMPQPFDHWDSRSMWHQAFYIEIPEEDKTIAFFGGGASSCRREHNGRWSHAFASLAKNHGIETPTHFMRYTDKNEWREDMRFDSFRCLDFDLSGNYHSNTQIMDSLFQGRLHTLEKDEDSYLWTWKLSRRDC